MRRTVLIVEPVLHERGRAWHWAKALHAAREACPNCRTAIPCHRHVTPRYNLVGFREAQGFDGSPALGLTQCSGCGVVLPHDLGPVIIGKTAMLAAACRECVKRHCGDEQRERNACCAEYHDRPTDGIGCPCDQHPESAEHPMGYCLSIDRPPSPATGLGEPS